MPTAKPPAPARPPLPFLVVHTALGILLKGRLHGTLTTLTSADLSRAIRIATARRQDVGHLLPGSHTLSQGGKRWQLAKKRELTAEGVAAEVAEWERLVALSHTKLKARKTKPRAAAPAPRYDVRAAWLEPLACWGFAVRHGGAVVLRGFLLGPGVNASAETLLRAYRKTTAGVAWKEGADVIFSIDHIGDAVLKRAKVLRPH